MRSFGNVSISLIFDRTSEVKKEGDDEESDSSDSDDDETSKPVMSAVTVDHDGGINRIRVKI